MNQSDPIPVPRGNPLTMHRALQINADVSYVEPGENGETVIITLSAWEAVAISMQNYAAANLSRRARGIEIIQPDVETALEEFVTVHWAKMEPHAS